MSLREHIGARAWILLCGLVYLPGVLSFAVLGLLAISAGFLQILFSKLSGMMQSTHLYVDLILNPKVESWRIPLVPRQTAEGILKKALSEQAKLRANSGGGDEVG